MQFFSEEKFTSFSLAHRHKIAGELLREIYEGNTSLSSQYHLLSQWLSLEPIDVLDKQALSNRYHHHLHLASVSLKEHNLLPRVTTHDKPSDSPFLDIAIYLDNLRSASNVGNIIRTVEALRLGSLYFGGQTPFIDNPKVQKTSMGTYSLVPCHRDFVLSSLPRPFVVLETIEGALSLYDVSLPSSFTLVIGNEEYGVSKELLKLADLYLTIPLCGSKNSLNVSNAFAITASFIRNINSKF